MNETIPQLIKKSHHHPYIGSDLLLLIFTSIFLIWYIQFLWGRRKIYECSRKLPGPLALPIIGSLEFVVNPYHIFSNMLRMANKYPTIFRIWSGPRMFCVVSDARYFEMLLPNFLEKDSSYKFAKPVTGDGLVTAPVSTWKRHRKLILPTFNQKILNGFVKVFSEQSEELVGRLGEVAGRGEFDVFGTVSNCTLNTIRETIMGVKLNKESKGDDSMSSCIDTILEIGFTRMIFFWYQYDFIFNLTSLSKKWRNALQRFHSFTSTVVSEKKKLFDEAKSRDKDTVQVNCEEVSRRKAFLDYLLEATDDDNVRFTEEELRDEVNTFIIAGSDSTASTISFILLMLGLHKDMQQKVYEEVLDIIGPDRAVEPGDLVSLKYVERFIKETLRLFPVAPIIVRNIQKDVDLGDCVIPGGTSVVFSFKTVHTNKKYWPDPYKFDPDRFLPEEIAKRHPCAYVPFSYGPRNCVGGRYAMMAMKSILATVVRKFKVSTSYKSVQDVELKIHLLLRAKDGFKVSLEFR